MIFNMTRNSKMRKDYALLDFLFSMWVI